MLSMVNAAAMTGLQHVSLPSKVIWSLCTMKGAAAIGPDPPNTHLPAVRSQHVNNRCSKPTAQQPCCQRVQMLVIRPAVTQLTALAASDWPTVAICPQVNGNHEMENQPDGRMFVAYNARYPTPQDPSQLNTKAVQYWSNRSVNNMYSSAQIPGVATVVRVWDLLLETSGLAIVYITTSGH